MIKKFCTRDNFWNLMFWVGMVIGSSLACTSVPWINGLILLSTATVVISFVYHKQPLVLNSDKIFVNSQGQLLNDRYPLFAMSRGMILVCVLFVVLCGLFMDRFLPKSSLAWSEFVGMLSLPFTLYFICTNCPISIIFHADTWKEEVTGWKITPRSTPSNSITHADSMYTGPITNPLAAIYNPSYSFLNQNIHNHNRHR